MLNVFSRSPDVRMPSNISGCRPFSILLSKIIIFSVLSIRGAYSIVFDRAKRVRGRLFSACSVCLIFKTKIGVAGIERIDV